MKHPWQIWLCYALSLAFVVPAMAWLTCKALELDRSGAEARRATEAARRQAEVQELVGSALWRMDWTLTPLIAQEAARPYFVYESFYESSDGKSGKQPSVQYLPSPLLVQPSEYVLLHFQVTPDNCWTSPQNPTGMMCTPALQNGATLETIQASGERLSQLRQRTNYRDLLAMVPDQLLPRIDSAAGAGFVGSLRQDPLRDLDAQVVNDLGLSQVAEPFPPQGYRGGPSQVEAPPPRMVQQFDAQLQQSLDPQAAGPSQVGQSSAAPQISQMQRGGNEWQHRNRAYQSYANNTVFNQRAGVEAEQARQILLEGVSRPLWVGDHLLMARRAVHENEATIQGCWLNWLRIREVLLAEIQDLLPNADLLPATPDTIVPPGRLLATLPVHLVVATEGGGRAGPAGNGVVQVPADESALSAIRISLLAAWSGLLLAAVAVAVLLQGVITLSERRAAFVSAVTHELRTPLTTFRLYAEMLSEGMVRGAEQTTTYLETLRVEADRLMHLVENVLQYARLERGAPQRRRIPLSVEELTDLFRERLVERARQAEMELQVDLPREVATRLVHTDPAAVEQIVFNLVDNACKYARHAEDRRIQLRLAVRPSALDVSVRDFGPGVPPRQARHLFRPFCKSADEAARTAPGVGLGLALSRRLAQDLGGQLTWQPSGELGACFILRLPIR